MSKTLIAIETAKAINAQVVLIVAPKNTRDGWEITAKRQGLGGFRQITSSVRGLKAAEDMFDGVPGVYFMTHTFFTLSGTEKVNDEGEVTRERRWHYRRLKTLDMVILDESHISSNRKSRIFGALKQLPKDAFRLAMSATPAGNQFDGFFAPTSWLWPKQVTNPATGDPWVEHRYWHWRVKWCNVETKYITVQGKTKEVDGKITEKFPGEFVKSLPCYIYYEAPKVPVHTRVVSIELTEKQKQQFNTLTEHYMLWLDDQPMVTELTIVQKTRLRQIGLGEITWTGEDNDEIGFAEDCKSAKADACVRIDTIHHPDDQIIYWTSSRKFAEVLAKRLDNSEAWHGGVSERERDRIKKDFIEGKVKNLVVSIHSLSEGVDGLQLACSTEVWLDKSFNGVKNEQAEGRINRQGQTADSIIRYELVADGTDDEKYLDRLTAQRVAMRESMAS